MSVIVYRLFFLLTQVSNRCMDKHSNHQDIFFLVCNVSNDYILSSEHKGYYIDHYDHYLFIQDEISPCNRVFKIIFDNTVAIWIPIPQSFCILNFFFSLDNLFIFSSVTRVLNVSNFLFFFWCLVFLSSTALQLKRGKCTTNEMNHNLYDNQSKTGFLLKK